MAVGLAIVPPKTIGPWLGMPPGWFLRPRQTPELGQQSEHRTCSLHDQLDFPTDSLHGEFENTTLIWFDFQTMQMIGSGMLSIPPSEVPRSCNIADALEVVGDRWSLLVVRELFYGPQRFTDIARHTGAPRDILAVRLRKLEEHGILLRIPYSEHPPRYEYRLTPSGRALSPVLLTLKRWGSENLPGGADPTVLRHSCGAEFLAQVHCKACGEALPSDASDAGKLFVAKPDDD